MFSWIKTPWWKRTEATQDVASDVLPPPRIIPRPDHTISRALISESALKVLYRLQKEGYEAYLVGGGVRDLLLGREPKDFDVATSARPEEMKRLFRNCRLIGRRFLLAHVQFGREIIEVATFRAQHDGDDDVSESGMLLRDNVYGTLEDDAWRRDFTINALYYNVGDFSVVDHTGGMEDLKAGILRVIGDPVQRFREDPVRMLRAVRFAAKLGFQIDEATEAALYELGHLLEDVAPARLFDESLKLFLGGYGVQTYELLRHYRLFGYLFPETELALAQEENHFPHTMLLHALENTDARIAEEKPVTPAFLFAALLWEPLRREAALFMANNMPEIQALQLAGDAVVSRQVQRVAVPKRFTLQSREIWTLQERLLRRNGKRAWAMVENPRFRAAYDFLLLRAQSGEEVAELAQWWSDFQSADEEGRKRLVEGLGRENGPKTKAKRRRRSPRPRPNPSAPTS